MWTATERCGLIQVRKRPRRIRRASPCTDRIRSRRSCVFVPAQAAWSVPPRAVPASSHRRSCRTTSTDGSSIRCFSCCTCNDTLTRSGHRNVPAFLRTSDTPGVETAARTSEHAFPSAHTRRIIDPYAGTSNCKVVDTSPAPGAEIQMRSTKRPSVSSLKPVPALRHPCFCVRRNQRIASSGVFGSDFSTRPPLLSSPTRDIDFDCPYKPSWPPSIGPDRSACTRPPARHPPMSIVAKPEAKQQSPSANSGSIGYAAITPPSASDHRRRSTTARPRSVNRPRVDRKSTDSVPSITSSCYANPIEPTAAICCPSVRAKR